MTESKGVKFSSVLKSGGKSAFRTYRELYYGQAGWGRVVKGEILDLLIGGLPGGLGLLLRSRLYRGRFASAGRSVFFGRHLTLRHAHKIRLGQGVVIDDSGVLDAKGEGNKGIVLGDGVYIGRNTIIYCKNGDIQIGDNVNISANCQVLSSNRLTIGSDTVIGAFSYLLSGGEYDYADKVRTFSQQSGMGTKGELVVGSNCWIGAGVIVLDAASIGDHCVIGAGAVVTKPIPPHSLAVGIPARVVKSIG
jgi:acetyltransferase-like isoleucine patch superfamily enzyme